MMNKSLTCIVLVVLTGLTVSLSSFTWRSLDKKPAADSNVMFRGGKDTIIVLTETLADDVIGYEDITPLKICIVKDKIVKVEALPNQETRQYFYIVRQELLPKWIGMDVRKANPANVDGISGATWSSDAVIENVKRGVAYYTSHSIE